MKARKHEAFLLLRLIAGIWVLGAVAAPVALSAPREPFQVAQAESTASFEEVRYGTNDSTVHEVRLGGDTARRPRASLSELNSETAIAGIGKVFVDRFGLAVPLGDVVLLVILTNVFALFRASRMILLMSYLFALKWVLLSNYQEVAHYSISMAHLTTAILAICGVFTLVLFCLDWFNKR